MGSSGPSASTSVCTFNIDPSSPLFLSSSDVPGISLTIPFSGVGFGGWKRNMIVFLSARNKIGFIDGSCIKPPENSPQYRQWDRCNNMVISWFTHSLSPDIAESVQYSETAESIWKQLNNRYGAVNGTKVFELKRQLASTYQESLDIASYFNKLKKQKQFNPQAQQRQFHQRVTFDQSRNAAYCKYCTKPGHMVENCYKLIGFPSNFKFTKGRKGAANMVENSDLPYSECVPATQPTQPSVSQHDHGSGQAHMSDSGSSLNIIASANFAGTYLPKNVAYSFNSALLTQSDSLTWIIDSGASDHMTSNKDFLINIKPLPIPFLVSLPNGYKVKVTCTGSFVLTDSIILQNGPSLKKPMDLGKLDNGLYKFIWEKPSQSQSILPSAHTSSLSSLCTSSSPFSLVQTVSSTCNKATINDMDCVWHNMLAHVPFAKMKCISEISHVISYVQSFPCDICPMAWQTRIPFPDSSIHTFKPFQLIHVDIWGSYHTPTYSGSRYFLTIVDDFSRSTWNHLLESKSNAFSLLKAFVAMVKTQFHVTV
uniref:Retrovirus-related Pol polyprotein from transposon TNT 1-94 n=1 Tax=Nicotiana tabacum TaxID=4097 RepID=A0A1S4D2D3_TOBAC|nr:PREDICTED: uncharacterized protein LOC107825227 [Nicotiana tabacum]